jgi:hypothetical protein
MAALTAALAKEHTMSRQSSHTLFAAVALGALALGTTLSAPEAEAFGRGGLGASHVPTVHVTGARFHASTLRGGPARVGRGDGPRPYPHPVGCHFGTHCRGHFPIWGHRHFWPHPYGIVVGAPIVPVAGPVQVAATCGKPIASGTFITVAFVPTATAADITAFLLQYKAEIMDGPNLEGIYRLKVSDQALSVADLQNLMDAIKAQTAIVRYAAA